MQTLAICQSTYQSALIHSDRYPTSYPTSCPGRNNVSISKVSISKVSTSKVSTSEETRQLPTVSSSDPIIEAAQQGSSFAFDQLIERYQASAQRLAQQILRTEEAAADAVQEALLKAYQAITRFEEGNFRSWLLRIVANTCYDHLRRQKRRKAISLDELIEKAGFEFENAFEDAIAPSAESPEKMFIQQETMTLLLQAIDELPAWHRTVVLLIDVHGYDYAEAAAMLKLPLGTVKSRLSRARVTLRDRLFTLQLKGS